jgi:hypothetical protein
MSKTRWALGSIVLVMATGCALEKPPAEAREAELRARTSRCTTAIPADRLPKPTDVVAVEPMYSRVLGGPNDYEMRLVGARVRLSATWSRTPLADDLACHQVDVAKGRVALRDDDPFALPTAWVDVDAQTHGDSTTLVLEAPTFLDAQSVLSRARRFASATSAK